MVRIKENKLIIEIDCGENAPLALLGNLQTGIMNVIEVVDYETSHSDFNTIQWGIVQLSRLMKEMLISSDQLSDINKSFTDGAVNKFNER